MKLLHKFAGAFALIVYVLIASMPVGYVVAQAPGFINQYNAVCDPSFPTRCAKPDVSGNLPVTGSFALTNPTIGSPVPSTGNYIAGNKAGNLTGVTLDGSSNLNINCVVGCAGGTFNNNADAVATSATNGQVAAWMYGYNGATFDRLRVDASKNLLTALNAAIPTGANTIGAVTQASGPWTVNQTQINGVALLAGNGVTGTGSPRVTIASDNTAFAVNATLSAETTKVIGTVRNLGNAGAIFDGATGSAVPANVLYMGISDGGTLRGLLQAANALNSTGTGIPTAQIVGQFDDVAPTAITENQFGNLRMSANRNAYMTLRDAAGNERGLNIDANGALAATVTNATAANLKAQVSGATTPADALALGTTSVEVIAKNNVYNGTTTDLQREVANSTNSTGTGIAAAGLLAQCDDTAPTAITENSFGNARLDCTDHTQAVGGLATTAAPSYTTGTARGLSLTTAGGLRSDTASIAGTTTLTGNGTTGAGSQRVTIASDNTAFAVNATLQTGSNTVGATFGFAGTIKSSVTRPADTNIYAANDAWSDSTSAPTSGGFTFTSACRTSGGSGIITDILVSSSNDPATLLQGELWILDQAGTNINDNAAFTMSDSDVLNVVAVVPFTLASTQAGSGANSFASVQNLSIGYTCVGTANLRYLVKVKNAYTPASAEKLQFNFKFMNTN